MHGPLWAADLAPTAAVPPIAAASPIDLPPGVEPSAVAVVLNAVVVSDGELLFTAVGPGRPGDAGLWVPVEKLLEWRLKPDSTEALVINGRPHQLVCSRRDFARCVLEVDSTLTIDAEPGRFTHLRIGIAPSASALPAAVSPLGGYLNYELHAELGRAQAFSAFTDLNVFSPLGDFYLTTGSVLIDGRTRVAARAVGWQWDMPAVGRSVNAGVYTSIGSAQRAPLSVSGLRYASNRALRPEVSLVPRPFVSGQVERPSRADLFVDGLFRRSGEVPYGGYDLQADGLLSGAGRMQVVLTDQSGLQTVQDLNYYHAPQLLPAGLSEFSVEVGALNTDPARPSLGSHKLLAAQRRSGLTDRLTVSYETALAPQARLAGTLADYLLQERGVLRGGLTLLDRGEGLRARLLLGHEYQSRVLSTLLRYEVTPGDSLPGPNPLSVLTQANGPSSTLYRYGVQQSILPTDRRSLNLALSTALNDQQQISALLTDRTGLRGEHAWALSAAMSYRPNTQMQWGFGLLKIGGDRPQALQWTVGLLMPLDAKHLFITSATGTKGPSSTQWAVQSIRNENIEERDDQYRVYGQVGRRAYTGASYQRNERVGQWAVDASNANGRTRAGAQFVGAVGWLNGYGFATRRINDSFMVVDTDGQPGVPVFYENRYAGKTDAAGKLLVPEARAYQANRVSLDASTLPIEFTLTDDQLDVVPRSRAGAVARFEIGDGGEMIAVRRADGSLLPTGARALISSQSKPTAIGSRGDLFINRAGRPAEVEVQWPGGSCRFEFKPDNPRTPRADAGAFTCR